jgi:hypothetical protein
VSCKVKPSLGVEKYGLWLGWISRLSPNFPPKFREIYLLYIFWDFKWSMHIPRVPILNAWILRAIYELYRRIVIILSFHVSINEPSSTHLVVLNAPERKRPKRRVSFWVRAPESQQKIYFEKRATGVNTRSVGSGGFTLIDQIASFYLHQMSWISIYAILALALALLLMPDLGAHGTVVIKQQNSTYVVVQNTYLIFELNNDTWSIYTRLPGGLVGRPINARLAGYDERIRYRLNTEPCQGLDYIWPLTNLSIQCVPCNSFFNLRVIASFTVVVLISLPVCVELFQTLFLEFLK